MNLQIEPIKYNRNEIDKGVILGTRSTKFELSMRKFPCKAKTLQGRLLSKLSPQQANPMIYIPKDKITPGLTFQIIEKPYNEKLTVKTCVVQDVTEFSVCLEIVEESGYVKPPSKAYLKRVEQVKRIEKPVRIEKEDAWFVSNPETWEPEPIDEPIPQPEPKPPQNSEPKKSLDKKSTCAQYGRMGISEHILDRFERIGAASPMPVSEEYLALYGTSAGFLGSDPFSWADEQHIFHADLEEGWGHPCPIDAARFLTYAADPKSSLLGKHYPDDRVDHIIYIVSASAVPRADDPEKYNFHVVWEVRWFFQTGKAILSPPVSPFFNLLFTMLLMGGSGVHRRRNHA